MVLIGPNYRVFADQIYHRGHALYPLHAKRSGMAFQSTNLVVTCHTSSRLSDFFKARTPTLDDLVIYGMEDQCEYR